MKKSRTVICGILGAALLVVPFAGCKISESSVETFKSAAEASASYDGSYTCSGEIRSENYVDAGEDGTDYTISDLEENVTYDSESKNVGLAVKTKLDTNDEDSLVDLDASVYFIPKSSALTNTSVKMYVDSTDYIADESTRKSMTADSSYKAVYNTYKDFSIWVEDFEDAADIETGEDLEGYLLDQTVIGSQSLQDNEGLSYTASVSGIITKTYRVDFSFQGKRTTSYLTSDQSITGFYAVSVRGGKIVEVRYNYTWIYSTTTYYSTTVGTSSSSRTGSAVYDADIRFQYYYDGSIPADFSDYDTE